MAVGGNYEEKSDQFIIMCCNVSCRSFRMRIF